ncbi:hypothetical protein HZS61_001091 [Fusarium oxysporum f. sp. conglutinans]|uniref:Uncharacterized protein n=1 Tax=Fusarium oxysporum f. sp. conglutinans TaxID=100902 RepID=A0A8H6H4W1_FUSOX|nr:hypothetical protein HZS61_001091 [Fusarium oxysporum f. sp. conglutinans]
MDTPNPSGPRTNTDTSPGYQDIDSPEIIAPFDFLIPASFSETHSPWAILDEASAVISPEDPHTRDYPPGIFHQTVHTRSRVHHIRNKSLSPHRHLI